MAQNKVYKLLRVLLSKKYRRAFLIFGVAASIEHDDFLSNLSKSRIKCVIDIGANRGQFALAARNYFPSAKIYCFEPLLEPAKTLRNVFKDDALVSVNEIAIGATQMQSVIHVSKQDDSSSLLPITSLQSTIYPGTDEKETRSIQVKPLGAIISDSEIEQPALLKIDVQGYEGEVLKGCISLLPGFSYIYVECSFIQLYSNQVLAHEVITFLNNNGFDLSGIYNLAYDKKGSPIQGDFFFKRFS